MSGLVDERRYTVPEVAVHLGLPEERIIEDAALGQAKAGSAAGLSEQATASERRGQGLEDSPPAALGTGGVISEGPTQLSDLVSQHGEGPPAFSHLEHPVAAYLNGLASSSRRPQLSALEWIARRSTQVYTAETMPWQRLRRPHVLKIRRLLEEHYQPATANRTLSALRGVLRECWQGQLMTTEEHQAVISVPAVRGESERRGRDLSAADLRGLSDACTRPPRNARGQDSAARRRRDAAFLALTYGCGLRRSEAVGVDVADLDLISSELRVRLGKGKKPRQVNSATVDGSGSTGLAAGPWLGTGPTLLCCPQDWPPGSRRCRPGSADARCGLAHLPAARLKAQIQALAPHDLRRTWIGDLLDLGVDLATVQKMAGHASASTTAGYDRRDRGVQRRAAVLLHVPYTSPED